MKNDKLLLVGLGLVGVGLAIGGGYYVANTQRMNGPRYDRLLPEVKQKLQQHLAKAQAAGLDVMFFEGWRDPEDEKKAIASGTSKLKDPLDTTHVWGAGYDIVFRNGLGLPYWPPAPDQAGGDQRWKQLAQIGESIGMRSGGLMWNWDWPHFQLPNINTVALKQQYSGDYLAFLEARGAVVA